MRIKVAPSILSADFAYLAQEIERVKGADMLHIDVMDGHFVPNITIGMPVVAAIRQITDLPLDVHLMIEKPEQFHKEFIEAGADILTVHIEATNFAHKILCDIRKAGKKAGISINPQTSVAAIEQLEPFCDRLTIMSVNPGFGGQQFIEQSLKKIITARKIFSCEIAVDGGVTLENARIIAEAGANVLISGNSIFKSDNPQQVMKKIRESMEEKG